MNKKGLIFVFLTIVVVFTVTAQKIPAELAETIKKISEAWEKPYEEGILIWESILSEDSFIMIAHNETDETQTNTLLKEDFFKALQMVYTNNPSVKHIHKTVKIKIYGNIAYEIANLEDHKKNGNIRKSQVLNIYKKEENMWKIIFTTSVKQVKAVF